jgi:signal transduction histidine kinase
MDRRKRQFWLFLVAIVLPAASLSILTFRFLRQDEELARQREPEQRREAVEQARRELAARLETIRLQEINRRVTELESAAAGRPSDSAIVFVTPVGREGLALPWENQTKQTYPSPRFVSNKDAGESLEFQSKDFIGATAAYRLALAEARQPEEDCDLRLSLGRVLVKAGMLEAALESYRHILRVCSQATDDAGMPFALYAADRLIALKLDVPLAEDYLIRQIHATRLRRLPQTYMMRTLLESIGSSAGNRALLEVTEQIADLQQFLTLAKEFQRVQPLAEKKWVAYGEEPWLLKLTPADPFPSLLFAVSSRKVAPPGTRLMSVKTARSYTLSEGFAELEIELDPNRSFPGNRTPAALIAGGIGLILLLTMLSGYLFLHGVNRDLHIAEMRSHFVASVSHELKTPLTAIRMFAETLALGRTRDETTRSEYLETIVDESERLARLVDNVLDFSKIEQGKKIYRMRPTALADVVRSAARAMRYPLSQQGFDLSVSIDERLPKLSADPDALEQAILNLLSNAMKYSKTSRQIDLSCSRYNGDAVIAVTDHGIGIATTDQARIFEKFYRVRSQDTDLIAGTGLGLTLVKHIAQSHGGSVDVQSVPGRGSTFSIRIPVPPEASA